MQTEQYAKGRSRAYRRRHTLGMLVMCGAACLLGGCPSAPTIVSEANQQLQAAEQIVAGYDGIAYALPLMDAPVQFSLDEKAQIINNGGRRRYIKGFLLPEHDGPLAMNIISFRMGRPGSPAILYPDVRVLDADFREVGVLAPASYAYRTLRQGDGMTATLFINSRNRGERYVVVTERDIAEAEAETYQQNIVSNVAVQAYGRGAVFTWFIPMGTSSPPVKMIASPKGKLEVSFQPYRPLKMGEEVPRRF